MRPMRSMNIIFLLCVGALLATVALGQDPPQDDPDELLPPAAKPGEYHARVSVSPVYPTETETIGVSQVLSLSAFWR